MPTKSTTYQPTPAPLLALRTVTYCTENEWTPSLATAVAVGALIGPAQVAGRLLEIGVLRHFHPFLSARLAAVMHPIGAAVFTLAGAPGAAAFALLHGAGNGILTIANGTLPLVLFGPHGYGQRQSRLTRASRLAQALSPWLFGLCLTRRRPVDSPDASLTFANADARLRTEESVGGPIEMDSFSNQQHA